MRALNFLFSLETMYEFQQTTLYFALKKWHVTNQSLFTPDINDKWKTIRDFDKILMANGIISILYNIYSI